MQWQELERWDWQTCLLMISVAITVWGSWQMFCQCLNLWWYPERKGESLSYKAIAYFLMRNIVVGLYGWQSHRLALLINGTFYTVVYLPVIVGLFKLKPLTRLETRIISPLLLVTLVAAVMQPTLLPDLFFLTAIGGMFFQLTVPWEIWKNKERGVVRVQVYVPFVCSAVFWWVYGVITHEPILMWTSPIFVLVLAITIAVWIKYPNRSIERD